MENETMMNPSSNLLSGTQPELKGTGLNNMNHPDHNGRLAEILFITSYPPRECGLATYSQDLIDAMNAKFGNSFKLTICPLESEHEKHAYPCGIDHILDTSDAESYSSLIFHINTSENIRMVMIQHEFGLFENHSAELQRFIKELIKPVIIAFHTVLPLPDTLRRSHVQQMALAATSIIVMTHASAAILKEVYDVPGNKIHIIPHGTHLVTHADKIQLKSKYNLSDKTILSTFGLLSSGKSIETTLSAMPSLIARYPKIVFLIIGKTHPSVIKNEGSRYRNLLDAMIKELKLENHIYYINYYLPLTELLDYLQMTDIYLFTSKDPHQTVSGTFSYALSCGCPIISTPIPHAREVLKDDAGIIMDFEASGQLAAAVDRLLNDESLMSSMRSAGLHKIAPTAWENSAISHARLFERTLQSKTPLEFSIPPVNLAHIRKMTTDFGILQFSLLNQPDPSSGYTLDDNARALIAMCRHFELSGDPSDIDLITIYLNFIGHCLQPEGYFLNYVNTEKSFTEQNSKVNLADANGRAVWALGYLVAHAAGIPAKLAADADHLLCLALLNVNKIHSSRAMAFVIKGIYYRNLVHKSDENMLLVDHLANRLIQMYRHEANSNWQWYESYLTYANSVLPEAMLCAWLVTGNPVYRDTAQTTFDFLLSKTFTNNNIKVISNKCFPYKEGDHIPSVPGGEQPIDVAYTIMTLCLFYEEFRDERYLARMQQAFHWFLGCNSLNQIIYNPCTGGCYDGLENNQLNLNQGAESTISYLMARLTIGKNSKVISQAKRKQHSASLLPVENEYSRV